MKRSKEAEGKRAWKSLDDQGNILMNKEVRLNNDRF